MARLPIVGVGMICGLVLFVWARRLYGEMCALFSLFLYSFSPNILANTRLATTDMLATCFIFLSAYAFWLFMRSPVLKNVILTGLFLGLAQLSKYNAVLLYPVFFVILLFQCFSERKKPDGSYNSKHPTF